jgi:hypothetical protein
MKMTWCLGASDIEKVKRLIEKGKDYPLTRERTELNLRADKPQVQKADCWREMVICLVITQRSPDPDKPAGRFIETRPFPLRYVICLQQETGLKSYTRKLLKERGIGRQKRISKAVVENWIKLDDGFWGRMLEELENLRQHQDAKTERKTADFIQEEFTGFGPKQARNFLQSLGLTRYEIPIGGKVAKWLNHEGWFPVPFSADALADRVFYCFVLDRIRDLCEKAGVFPCILDAAIAGPSVARPRET